MVELAGLGYHIKNLTRPEEKVALVRKVFSFAHLYFVSRNTKSHLVLLRPRTSRLSSLHNPRQNLYPPFLHPDLLHPQIPDSRLPRRISSPSHWHHSLFPNHFPMLTGLLWLESYRRSWNLHRSDSIL